MKKYAIISTILLIAFALLPACNSDEVNNETTSGNEAGTEEESEEQDGVEGEDDPDPVTLQMAFPYGEQGFIDLYKDPIEDALPHITMEFVDADMHVEDDVEALVVSNQIPDFFVGSGSEQLRTMQKYEIDFALDDLFERHGFDWSRLDQNFVQRLRNIVQDEQMYVIPVYRRAHNIYYNIDIFDRFGVGYPTDGMTWDDVANLAAQVTGEEDGVQYRGFDIVQPSIMLDQRKVTHVHPETHEVLYLEESIYSEYLQYLERLWSIPGILPEEDPGDYLFRWGANFFNDLDVAMTIAWDRLEASLRMEEEQGFNWDIVTMPVWEDQPNINTYADAEMIFPASVTDHPEAMFEVLNFILSDEFQEWGSRELARPTVLSDPDIQQTFGSELEGLETKNVDSIFMLESNVGLPANELSPYRNLNYDALYRGVQEFARLETDVNTFLRQMTEETTANIEEAMQIE